MQNVGHVVIVTFALQPALSVPVRAIRAASEGCDWLIVKLKASDWSKGHTWAPPALQLFAVLEPLEVQAGVQVLPVKVGVGQAGAAVEVGVTSGQGLEEDGGLVRDSLVLHTETVILVNCFPSRN